jgi:hypothetical protein
VSPRARPTVTAKRAGTARFLTRLLPSIVTLLANPDICNQSSSQARVVGYTTFHVSDTRVGQTLSDPIDFKDVGRSEHINCTWYGIRPFHSS